MVVMFTVSRLTSRKLTSKSFFSGDRKAPWAVVAYGMVGTVISGVTFVSVPGNVMKQNFYYMPLVFGFVVGYMVIAKVLLPLYYRMNITSIYAYLGKRFGPATHKTGSAVFLVSRVLGAAVRIFVVTLVQGVFSLVSKQFDNDKTNACWICATNPRDGKCTEAVNKSNPDIPAGN